MKIFGFFQTTRIFTSTIISSIILIPAIPETNKGQIFVVKEDKLERVSSLSANEFDKLLRGMGKGLLSRHPVDIRIVRGN